MRLAAASRSTSRPISALLVLWTVVIASASATAVTFDLDTELDTGANGPFSTIEINEDEGALDFVISLDRVELGPNADLHVFYFNLVHDAAGLAIRDTDAPNTEYTLVANPSVAGGAGSSFDWAVHFGNGAGPTGNGTLQSARFRLVANEDLSVDHLLGSSFAAGGSIEIQMAAHIQGTSALTRASSETIGGIVPEPSTGLLLLSGLALLARRGHKTRHRFVHP